jgi:hypothetical protein
VTHQRRRRHTARKGGRRRWRISSEVEQALQGPVTQANSARDLLSISRSSQGAPRRRRGDDEVDRRRRRRCAGARWWLGFGWRGQGGAAVAYKGRRRALACRPCLGGVPEANSAMAQEESGSGTAEVGDGKRVPPVGGCGQRREMQAGAGPRAKLGCGLRSARTRAALRRWTGPSG